MFDWGDTADVSLCTSFCGRQQIAGSVLVQLAVQLAGLVLMRTAVTMSML